MSSAEAKVTSSGQMSLPAVMRNRWQVHRVLVVDRGDYAIVRPIPEDIPKALRGRFVDDGPTSEQMRSDERRQDAERETMSQ